MKLSGETIKNAISEKILEIFPNYYVYKEEQSTLLFPHFFILQLNLSSTEDRKDHYFQTYVMNIRFRQVADVATEPKIEQKLDDVGVQLLTNFTEISLVGRPVKIREAYYEKVDKVLHFSCQIKVQIEKEKPEEVKMLRLEQETNMKGV